MVIFFLIFWGKGEFVILAFGLIHMEMLWVLAAISLVKYSVASLYMWTEEI